MARVFSFRAPVAFQPHFNVSVGRFVSSERDFNESLKELSDKQSERTGIAHNYVPADISDSTAFGATDEGMDDFYREHYNSPVESVE